LEEAAGRGKLGESSQERVTRRAQPRESSYKSDQFGVNRQERVARREQERTVWREQPGEKSQKEQFVREARKEQQEERSKEIKAVGEQL
jgi:hypothetical protein